MKQAEVRFYVDADILGLGKVLAGLRSDLTYPGDPGATIHKRTRPPGLITSPRVKDSQWISLVSRQGLLIITRDSKNRQHRAEVAAVLDNNGGMVALASSDATSTWAQWRRIEALTELTGPFIYTAARTSLVKVA